MISPPATRTTTASSWAGSAIGWNKSPTEYDEVDIPEEFQAKFDEWETELQETLATTDEALLDRYLEKGSISREEAIEAMHNGVASGDIVPLFCGSAKHSYGMQALLKKLVELCPSPAEAGGETARRAGKPRAASPRQPHPRFPRPS